MLTNKETDFAEISPAAEILNRNNLNQTRGVRWVKLADTTERSLYWLVSALTLAYIVFRILPLLSSQ